MFHIAVVGQSFVLTSTHTSSGKSFQVTETGISYAVTGSGNVSTFARSWDGSGNRDDRGYAIAATSDGGFVVAGLTYSFGAGSSDVFISKYDVNGVLAWTKSIGEPGYDEANSIIQTADGGFAICGAIDADGNEDSAAFISKLDSHGSLVWSKSWDRNGLSIATSIAQTSDNNLVIVGTSSDLDTENQDAFIIKYDFSNGNILWDKVWTSDEAAEDYASSVSATSDGGIIVSGRTSSFGSGGDIFVAKMDSGGDLSWSRTFGGGNSDSSSSILQTTDGGYVLAGKTHSFGLSNDNIFIAKLGVDGNISWQKLIVLNIPLKKLSI